MSAVARDRDSQNLVRGLGVVVDVVVAEEVGTFMESLI
jgi:hypothetical protein